MHTSPIMSNISNEKITWKSQFIIAYIWPQKFRVHVPHSCFSLWSIWKRRSKHLDKVNVIGEFAKSWRWKISAWSSYPLEMGPIKLWRWSWIPSPHLHGIPELEVPSCRAPGRENIWYYTTYPVSVVCVVTSIISYLCDCLFQSGHAFSVNKVKAPQ